MPETAQNFFSTRSILTGQYLLVLVNFSKKISHGSGFNWVVDPDSGKEKFFHNNFIFYFAGLILS
jgi:hypothetical protein